MVIQRSREETRAGYCVSKYDGEAVDDTEEKRGQVLRRDPGVLIWGETTERTWALAHLMDAALQMRWDFVFLHHIHQG